MAEAVGTLTRPKQTPPPVEVEQPSVADRISVATQWQLMWWRFRKHRLAIVAAVVIALFYVVVLFADFFAYSDPRLSNAELSLLPPQPIHWLDNGKFRPHVFAVTGKRDPNTFKKVYQPDPDKKVPLALFAKGYEYDLLGLFPTSRHLVGVNSGDEDAIAEESLFLIGTDLQGRDLFSRLMIATRLSMTIGLAGVALSLVLGITLGGLSGLYGGVIDNVIQRIIEIVRSIPTIPLWMGLAAAVPPQWPITRVYFFITLILGLIGWTTLARVTRGRFLSLRSEDFVTAAALAGGQPAAHHLFPHGPLLSQPHHRRHHAGPARHDHRRDGAELPGPRPAPARRQLGRAAQGRAKHPGRRHLALAPPPRRPGDFGRAGV